MPSWDDMRLFLECYRRGSATRAAKALDLNVSTVSRRLERFEAELGAALFLRASDGLTPTDAAERLFEAGAEVERRMAEGFAAVGPGHEEVSGLVRLASTPDLADLVLIPLLAPLFTAYPALELELVLGTDLSDLSRREADLAVRIGHPGAEPELVVRHIRDEPLGLFASRRYLAERPATLPLSEHRWLLLTPAGGSGARFGDWLRARVPDARIALRTNSFTTLHLAAAAGMGVAMLPAIYAAITPALAPVAAAEGLPPSSMYLVAHRATRRSAAVRAVWDYIAEMLTRRADRDDAALLRSALDSRDTTDANHSVSNVSPVRRE